MITTDQLIQKCCQT
jgi:dynein heavy chain